MSAPQLLLFDAPPVRPAPPCATLPRGADPGAATAPVLERLALLYTATEKGNHSGIRFMMSLEDAQAWCESPVSRGITHGTQWAYFYTTVKDFLTCYWTPYAPRIDLRGTGDDGSWDEKITALGLTKISLWQMAAALAPHGVQVKNVPPMGAVSSRPVVAPEVAAP